MEGFLAIDFSWFPANCNLQPQVMMKTQSTQRILLASILILALCFSSPFMESGRAQELTPDQIEKISAQLAAIRKVLSDKASSRNKSAADIFIAASQSDKAALTLYVDCYKKVNFELEGRKESDFRAWKDSQEGRFKDDAFIEGLRVQLRYLGLSCKAAESEELSKVFGNLMAFVDSLTQLEEMPGSTLMQSVNGTVFAKAYELNNQLAKNKSWEMVPYNIAGIYEKTILPYLRKENPEQLGNAWDKRIEQETRVVQFLEREKEKQQKGSRDDKRATRNKQSQRRQGNGGGVLRAHDKEFFIRETLPALQWGKMVDMFQYGNRPSAALGMLNFIKENITSPKAEKWMNQFATLLAQPSAPKRTPNAIPPSPTSSTPPSSTTQPIAGRNTTGSPTRSASSTTKTTGTVPPGLE